MSDTALATGDVLSYFESEKAKAVQKCEAIVNRAEKEHRTPTDDEREELKHWTTVAHEFNDEIKVERDNRELLHGIAEMSRQMSGEPVDAPRTARTLGEAFVQSEGYRIIKERGTTGVFQSGP